MVKQFTYEKVAIPSELARLTNSIVEEKKVSKHDLNRTLVKKKKIINFTFR